VDSADNFADNARATICPHGAPMKKGIVDHVDNEKKKSI
jgi:hypothetical protein